MGFHFNDFLLSQHCFSVLYADCMPPAQVSWALESGERGQFPLVTVVHSSTAPWRGRMGFLTERKQSLAGSYINGHLALRGVHTAAGLQCSSALPSHLVSWKEGGGWEEMEAPSDPSILNQLGTYLLWDRMVCWSMRGLKTGKKRFSLPWGLWTPFYPSHWKWSKQSGAASYGCASSRTSAQLPAWTKAPWFSNIPQTSIVPT